MTISITKQLLCAIIGHDPDDGTNHFDIPFHPWAIPDEYMRDGYVAITKYRCDRCGMGLERKFGHIPDQPVDYPLVPSSLLSDEIQEPVEVPPTAEDDMEFRLDKIAQPRDRE